MNYIKGVCYIISFLFLLFHSACIDEKNIDESKLKAEKLMKKLSEVDASLNYFPSAYFPNPEVVKSLVSNLVTCGYDFENTKYVDFAYKNNIGSKADVVDLIYKSEMNCDTVNIILTYTGDENPTLCRFRVIELVFEN